MGDGADCAGAERLLEAAAILRLAGMVGVVPLVASRFFAVSLRSRCDRPLTSGFSGEDIAGTFSCIITRCVSPAAAGDCASAIVMVVLGGKLVDAQLHMYKKIQVTRYCID
jgi:hypothetical protein